MAYVFVASYSYGLYRYDLDSSKAPLAGCRFPQPCALLQTNFRVLPLLSRGKAYAALMEHPVIRRVMKRLLGDSYMIGGFTSYVVGSGSARGNFHQDGRQCLTSAAIGNVTRAGVQGTPADPRRDQAVFNTTPLLRRTRSKLHHQPHGERCRACSRN